MSNAASSFEVGLVIPTFNAGPHWRDCLKRVAEQSLQPRRLLNIDSSSVDDTLKLSAMAGFETVSIDPLHFNHGGTRQWGVEHLGDCEIIIFMTQDAVPAEKSTFSEIVACFEDPMVAVAYGRQLPHPGAGAIASHARAFNYGPSSVKKNLSTAEAYKAKVFFCSNSFAAYRRSTLLSLGGFRRDLILGEDMEFAARAVRAGYTNAYCATAPVYHSHDYTAVQSFGRYFDIGVFDKRSPWLREYYGSHRNEGRKFVVSELKYLWAQSRRDIPKALLQTMAKLGGYRAGRLERYLPVRLKRKLSMTPAYWN